jgi:hypothetical protein
MDKKTEAYPQRTEAYMELPHDPLLIAFDKVTHLLNNLRSKQG